MMAVVFWMVSNVGPYHNARFRALAGTGRCDLVVAEIAPHQEKYPWTKMEPTDYRKVTLFPRVSVEHAGQVEVTAGAIARITKHRAQVYVSNGYSQAHNLAIAVFAKATGRVVLTVFPSTRKDRVRRPWVEQTKGVVVRNLFDGFFCAGVRSEEYLRQLGVPAERVQRGYDVVDNAHFAAPAQNRNLALPSGKYFLAVSRFSPEKNFATLCDAHKKYARRTDEEGAVVWPLVLCGSGPLDHELRARTAGWRAGRAIFLGFLGYHDLPEAYQRAGCLVLPSVSEPWGLVVNEAMAAGLPVLVSDRCGCAPELVREGENGFTFSCTDVDGLANSMCRIAGMSEDARRTMGRCGEEIISAYTPETWADNFLELVERCSARKRA